MKERRFQIQSMAAKVMATLAIASALLLTGILTSRVYSAHRSNANSSYRIAILLPFAGQGVASVPAYLPVFCMGAAGAANVADFFIFHNGAMDTWYMAEDCPPNVKFISLQSNKGLAERLMKVIDHKKDDELAVPDRDTMLDILTRFLRANSYGLVEFKPALGYIFQDYITDYSHWGYSDLDILFGDLQRWISKDEWTDYDIVTYGYGDQNRAYVRGQFTFHKNSEKTINIWRKCEYLSDMDKRFAALLNQEKHYRVESAEGCYSDAILQHDNISVKYAVKAWTDADESKAAFERDDIRLRGINLHDTAFTHGLYFTRSEKTKRQVIYKASNATVGDTLSTLSARWFETDDIVYRNRKISMQKAVGEREEVVFQPDSKANCMYWVPQQYQERICLTSEVLASETLYWIHGKLYKEKYANAELTTPVVTAPFYHFQNWKRWYRPEQLRSFHSYSVFGTHVLVQEGIIPVKKSKFAQTRLQRAPLGLDSVSNWTGVYGGDRSQLPNQNYCLISSGVKHLKSTKCDFVVSWRDTSAVEILHSAPGWSFINPETDVTLTLTLELNASIVDDVETLRHALDNLKENVKRWQGKPCVAVVFACGVTEVTVSNLHDLLSAVAEPTLGNKNLLLAVIYEDEDARVSRRALVNMVVDAVPTRWYLKGLCLECGMTLSLDTCFFAHKAAVTHGRLTGHAFLIPHYQVNDSNTALDPKAMVEKLNKGEARTIELDEKCTEVKVQHLSHLDSAWRLLTTDSARTEQEIAQRLDDLEHDIIELASGDSGLNIPGQLVMLVDHLGPIDGIYTREMTPEVEELSGMYCSNALHLSQLTLLGYELKILAGAFSVSSLLPRQQGIISENNLCEGCLGFDGMDSVINIVRNDALHRVAKAAILWEE